MTLKDLRKVFDRNTRFYLNMGYAERFIITDILWGCEAFTSMQVREITAEETNCVFVYTDMPYEIWRAWKDYAAEYGDGEEV